VKNELDALLAALKNYHDVTLVAVSKEVGVREIRRAYDLGLRTFGESRMQTALVKQNSLDLPVSWHFIGRLQTNKVRLAAGRFDLYHSLSGLHLAEEMNRIAARESCIFSCLVQVNAAGEETKQGLAYDDVPRFLDTVKHLPGVKILGLMSMGPNTDDPASIRRVFREVRALFDELRRVPVGSAAMSYLSMGMSADYQLALDEGANMLRIGRVIFSNLRDDGGERCGKQESMEKDTGLLRV